MRTFHETFDITNDNTTKRVKTVLSGFSIRDSTIIFRNEDLTLLDFYQAVANTWRLPGEEEVGLDWQVPHYWFNLQHPYVPYTQSTDSQKIAPKEETKTFGVSSIISPTTSLELTKTGFPGLEFCRDTLKQFTVSTLKNLFQQTLSKYTNTEPSRTSTLLWFDVINFPEYINMLTALCNSNLNSFSDFLLEISTQPLELSLDQVYFRHITNPNKTIAHLIISPYNEEYWLPPHSSFIISDLKQASQLLIRSAPAGGYDIIVMDPPYFNASVERSKKYATEDLYQLFNLPVSSIINQQTGILAVWITNRPKVRRFVINKLFKDWGFDLAAEWYWLKVTNDGTPVLNLESLHRKPYESILIGIKSNANITHNIPKQHTIISVPCKIHSRKPPIFDLLKNYIVSKPSRVSNLELFGRSMYPFTTTWGNEPIKFQRTNGYCPK